MHAKVWLKILTTDLLVIEKFISLTWLKGSGVAKILDTSTTSRPWPAHSEKLLDIIALGKCEAYYAKDLYCF